MKSKCKEPAQELREATILALEKAGINTTNFAFGVKKRDDPDKERKDEVERRRDLNNARSFKLRHTR